MDCTREELLVCAIAGLLEGCRNIAVGAASPIPAAAALLTQAVSNGTARASILGSNVHGPFNDGGPELFDRAGQGRVDAFFLGGGQIDGQANINLVGSGPYPAASTRFPGSFGSAYLYFMVPRVILFREEHSRRTLVERVDFVSAPGWSPPEIHRPGGPYALITSLCLFLYDRARRRFRLDGLLPGTSLEEVRDNTGFEFDCPEEIGKLPPPEPGHLSLVRNRVAGEIAETYPEFARARLGWQG